MTAQVLIFGATGDVGRPLLARAGRVPGWNVTGTCFSSARATSHAVVRVDTNISDEVNALFERVRPALVFHLAGSDRSQEMQTTIRQGTKNVAEACLKFGARLVYLSTDMVFNGRNPPYPEDASPSPLSPYGLAKADSEATVREGLSRSIVVRTSLVYDFDPGNRQVGWMIDLVKRKRQIPLFVDELRQPIWAWNLADALVELGQTDLIGIIHITGPELLSRWEFGVRLLNMIGLDATKSAVRVKAADVAPERPRTLALSNDKAQTLLQTRLLPIEQAGINSGALYRQANSTTTSLWSEA